MVRSFRASVRASALTLFGVAAFTYASAAFAGCGDDSWKHPASFQSDGTAASLLHRASLSDLTGQPIVGMWSFKMMAGSATVDYGYVQWHSDGTEIENSAGRAPSTENFCMGIWHPTGLRSFHLSHYALSYTTSGVLNGKVHISEDVTVNGTGTAYSGTFALDLYDPTSGALLQHVPGQVTAQRISN